MINRTKLLGWAAVMSWASFAGYYISTADMKLTMQDLLLMMPECSKMTNLVGRDYIILKQETMLKFYIAVIILQLIIWYTSSDEAIDEANKTASNMEHRISTETEKAKESEELVAKSAKFLLEDLEDCFQHTAAIIALNNETPGKKVGGEVEWASGETSSEDEDATREVFGAHITPPRKTEKQNFKTGFLQSQDSFDDIKAIEEPHLTKNQFSDNIYE